jgi:hypothetical protein
VLSPVARRRHGFGVESLPHSISSSHERLYASPLGQQAQDAFEERLRDNTQTPVADQVAFRIDFPVWRCTRTERNRRFFTFRHCPPLSPRGLPKGRLLNIKNR